MLYLFHFIFFSAAGYTFFVSNDSSTSNLQVLPNNHKSILTNVNSLLVDAGTNLELEIDFGESICKNKKAL